MNAHEPLKCPVCHRLRDDTAVMDIPVDGPMVQATFGQLSRDPAGPWRFEMFVNGERCPDVRQVTIDVHTDPQTSQPMMQIFVYTESAPPQQDPISGRWTLIEAPENETP